MWLSQIGATKKKVINALLSNSFPPVMSKEASATQKAFLSALKKPKSEKKVKASFDLIDTEKTGKHFKKDWTSEVMISTFKAVVEGLLHEPKKNNVSTHLRGVLASFFETIDYKDLAETLFTMTDTEKKGYLDYSDFQVLCNVGIVTILGIRYALVCSQRRILDQRSYYQTTSK